MSMPGPIIVLVSMAGLLVLMGLTGFVFGYHLGYHLGGIDALTELLHR